MKQLFQNLRSGDTTLEDVPCPRLLPGQVLIRTSASLISPGTERMLLQFGKAGIISKARQQPDKVRQVLDKVRTDGLLPTVAAVQAKLDQLIPLGYCNVGTVMDVGPGVTTLAVGDRVVSNGSHAEMIMRPVNLCARIPAGVSDDSAAFTVVSAIALQGVRLIQPTLGECVVVIGLGLIGLLTIQLLHAHGCRVLGVDIDSTHLALAQALGAETLHLTGDTSVLSAASAFSRGRGVDAVIITATTRSNDPVHQAAQMCRKRGRIVLVGVTGLELSRDDFYEKELSFQVSCSYGPGRYDSAYEDEGHDYPVGFIRWTEQRNFEAVLDMMDGHKIDVMPLVSHRFSIDTFAEAYAALQDERPLGILIDFPGEPQRPVAAVYARSIKVATIPARNAPGIVFVGAGNYATRTLMPAFAKGDCTLQAVVGNSGVNVLQAARKFGIGTITTDLAATLASPTNDVAVIATRHDSHAGLAIQALEAGKHVFVEKPLCTTFDQLAQIEACYDKACTITPGISLMIGFNRRFAPHVVRMKSLLSTTLEPKVILITVNAGAIPADHWTQDPVIGGGRIVGEACHFVDLARFLANSPIEAVSTTRMDNNRLPAGTDDNAAISLRFEDGSLATILYVANGHRSYPKERIEIFSGGRVLQLDNFRALRGHGWHNFKRMTLWRQDKGNVACVQAFLAAISDGGPAPIPPAEIFEVSQATLEAAAQLSSSRPVSTRSAFHSSMASTISDADAPVP